MPVPSARAALLALALASVSLACGGDPPPAAPTAKVEKARIERIVVATGTIEPAKEVEVRPRIPGIVEHILVKEGEQVVAGQVLVEIERELLLAQAQEAARGARGLEGREALCGDRARPHPRASEERRSLFPEARRRARALRERDRGRRALAARLRTLRTQLSYASVLSPLAGRVLDIPIEEGQAVSPVTAVTGGTLLLSLAATNALHLKGLVDENEVARVAIGQPARIRTEAFGTRVFAGQVLRDRARGSAQPERHLLRGEGRRHGSRTRTCCGRA